MTAEIEKKKVGVLQMIANLFSEERRIQIEELRAESDKHKPSGAFDETYESLMLSRHKYLQGDMIEDMKAILKRRFPNTYEKIWKDQLNLKLFKWQIEQKAKVFVETGEFYQVDKKGNRVEDPNFDKLIKRSRVLLAFKQMEKYTRAMHRCMFKPWWDPVRKYARINIWPSYLVHIVPSEIPGMEWDVDQARCVMFERQGVEGLNDTNKRYEIWAIRDSEAAKSTGKDTLHFITDGINQDYKVNEQDEIPYQDPRSKRHIFPFVWFQDDDETLIYKLGEGDALTGNRSINSGLTDLKQIIHMEGFGIWAHKAGDDNAPLGVTVLSPGQVVELAQGADLSHHTPNLNLTDALEFWKAVLDAIAKLDNLSSSAFQRKDSHPESGRALKIREKPQTDERKDFIGIWQEPVEEAIYRLMILHNAHADRSEHVNLDHLPKWSPGEPEIPSDPQEETANASAEQTMNVSTPIELRMKRYKEDRKTAEKAVLANAEVNKQLREASETKPMVETAFEYKARKEEEAAADKPEEKPVDKPDEKSGEGGATGVADLNVYQLAKMIEHNAASAVDMRMKSFGEDKATAEARVKENILINMEMSKVQGQQKGIEEAEMIAASPEKSKPAGNQPPPMPGEPKDEEEDEEAE